MTFMRRVASLAVCGLLLGGCHYASSPLVGFGGFVDDTHTFKSNPNLPPGNAENIRRVEGQAVTTEPLAVEQGNIWPGPPKPEPTLEDVIRDEQSDQSQSPPPGQENGSTVPYGSSAHPQPRPAQGSGGSPGSVDLRSPPATPRVTPTPPGNIVVPPASINTPHGVQPLTRDGNGVTTTTTPGGGTSIVVPNGNGTSTIIGPDGSTQTVPTPR